MVSIYLVLTKDGNHIDLFREAVCGLYFLFVSSAS